MPGGGSSGRSKSMAAGHTGSNHDRYGCSARTMLRAWNLSGSGGDPADGVTIELYPSHLKRKSDRYAFRKTNPVNPTRYQGSGTGDGQIGDPNIWTMPIGEWVTVICGMGVGDNHFYRAYTSTETEPVPKLRLELTHAGGWRWMADEARQTLDSWMFQSLYGGSASESEWQPDSESGMLQYKGIRVFDSNPISQHQIDTARDVPSLEVLDLTEQRFGSGHGGNWTAEFELAGSTGTERVAIVLDDKKISEHMVSSELTKIIIDGLTGRIQTDLSLIFVNDGRTPDGQDRNVFFEKLTMTDYDTGTTWIVDKTHPSLYSTAAWKNGPAQGNNVSIKHMGKMYRSGKIEFIESIRALAFKEAAAANKTTKAPEFKSLEVVALETRVDKLEAQNSQLIGEVASIKEAFEQFAKVFS